MRDGFIWRCRRTFIFRFSNCIFQTITMADSIIQIGEACIGLGTCRFEGSMCVLLFLPRPRGTSASLVVPKFGLVFASLWRMRVWQVTFSAPSHCVRLCLRDLENTALRCGLTPILLVLFVPVPVGRINCLLDLSSMWVCFLSLFPFWFGSCPFCSAHLTQRRFDVRVGMLLNRLPPSVSQITTAASSSIATTI